MGIMLYYRRPTADEERRWILQDEVTGKQIIVANVKSDIPHETKGPVKNARATHVLYYPDGEIQIEGDTAWIRATTKS